MTLPPYLFASVYTIRLRLARPGSSTIEGRPNGVRRLSSGYLPLLTDAATNCPVTLSLNCASVSYILTEEQEEIALW